MKAGNRETEDQRIGSLIRILRHQAGLSQTELGKAIDVTFQQIQKYEKGTNRVASSTLPALSKVLGVPPTYFFEKHKAATNSEGESALALLADKRAHRLLAAFCSIKGNKLRDALVDLAETLAANKSLPRR